MGTIISSARRYCGVMKHWVVCCFVLLLALCSCREERFDFDNSPRVTRAPGFVYLEGDRFMVDDSVWVPVMLNYKIDWRVCGDTIEATPVSYYEVPQRALDDAANLFEDHFRMIAECAKGVNALRVCIDVMNSDSNGYYYNHGAPAYIIRDSAKVLSALDDVVGAAEACGLRVMFLMATPIDEELETFTAALLRHYADNPTVWAYDFMNEPLYFDTVRDRTKESAYLQADRWRRLMNQHAPHQLFTIGFSEPTEVFSWDPSLMPVDFVEVHTYHPLRVASEMWWYGHYIGKPWIIGETALPAENDSVPYEWQGIFLRETYQCAIDNGAAGYGWWEFMDFPMGRNFEHQYTGVFSHEGYTALSRENRTGTTDVAVGAEPPAGLWTTVMKGSPKPVASVFAELGGMRRREPRRPDNYQNMMGYENFCAEGRVTDEKGRPIEGAVIRAWNRDWSIAQNTFSMEDGTFRLYSNDLCLHFWVSAPGMSTERFDVAYDTDYPLSDLDTMPNRDLEYQMISYVPFLKDHGSMLTFGKRHWGYARMMFGNVPGRVVLRRLR